MISTVKKANIPELRGLGCVATPDKVLLYFTAKVNGETVLHTATSKDGIQIHTRHDHPKVLDEKKHEINPDQLHDFQITQFVDKIYLIYEKANPLGTSLYLAESDNFIHWQTIGKVSGLKSIGIIAPRLGQGNTFFAYNGKDDIYLSTSNDLLHWDTQRRPVLFHKENQFGSVPLQVSSVLAAKTGIVLLYLATSNAPEGKQYSLHAANSNPKAPQQITSHSLPLWEQGETWVGDNVTPFGTVAFGNALLSYWNFHSEGMFAISHRSIRALGQTQTESATDLKRLVQNPLIIPKTVHHWESKATFNPAAVTKDGQVHLLYRAIGDTDVSVMGYAVSKDGVHFKRLTLPAYVPRESFEGASATSNIQPASPAGGHSTSNTSPFISGGGGSGGCEDPRLTQINGRFYLTYVAYDGSSAPRVALSSISVEDFVNRVFDWAKPVLISPPGIVDKNAVIFPEKINGKYVILHRIYPNILIDYVDSLDFDGKTFLKGKHKIKPTRMGWDNRKIGAGPPPIKTKDGWLLIYHSVGEDDPGRYKMGAMLLDHKDPAKVICRSIEPILTPDHEHENNGWKSGVAYPCGAVVIDQELYVYYGGADMVVCSAVTNLDTFLTSLQETGRACLEPINIHAKHKIQ